MAIPQIFRNGFLGVLKGQDLNNAISAPLYSYQSGITAKAGGGQASATKLLATLNEVDTVGTAADSVQLPFAKPGLKVVVVNNAAANACQVFAGYNDPNNPTINGTAGTTGVSLAAGKTAEYVCVQAGKWFQLLSA